MFALTDMFPQLYSLDFPGTVRPNKVITEKEIS